MEEVLRINKLTAIELYNEVPEKFKRLLEEAFGKEIFIKPDYTTLKTFAELCLACGTTEEEFNKKCQDKDLSFQTTVFEKMEILSDAINQGWKPDHFNTDEKKWFPYFNISSSGFGFSHSSYYFDGTYASVGSRLCFETEEKSNYAGETFTKLFQQFITGKE